MGNTAEPNGAAERWLASAALRTPGTEWEALDEALSTITTARVRVTRRSAAFDPGRALHPARAVGLVLADTEGRGATATLELDPALARVIADTTLGAPADAPEVGHLDDPTASVRQGVLLFVGARLLAELEAPARLVEVVTGPALADALHGPRIVVGCEVRVDEYATSARMHVPTPTLSRWPITETAGSTANTYLVGDGALPEQELDGLDRGDLLVPARVNERSAPPIRFVRTAGEAIVLTERGAEPLDAPAGAPETVVYRVITSVDDAEASLVEVHWKGQPRRRGVLTERDGDLAVRIL